MGQLPDAQLIEFKRGTQLTAQALNQNFVALLNLAQTAITLALTPDEAITGVEARMGALERRLAGLEAMAMLHERQRNAKEWAPLATLGAVLVRVTDLQRVVEEAASRLLDAHAEIKGAHEDLGRRLARIEQRPEAATQEDHMHAVNELARLTQLEATLLSQVHGLRAEAAYALKIAQGHDRVANRMEFTPLSTTGHLLQRIMDIEKRLQRGCPP